MKKMEEKFLESFFKTPVTFSKGEQKILKYLYNHPEISIYDLSKELNATYVWVHQVIRQLEKIGLIKTIKEKVPHGKGYKVIIKMIG